MQKLSRRRRLCVSLDAERSRDDRNDLWLSHFPWLLDPDAGYLGRAWVDRYLHRHHEHHSLLTRWLGPRSRRISDHDLTTRFSDEGRPVPRRVILPAEARSDARGAGDNTELMGCDIAFSGSLAAVAE